MALTLAIAALLSGSAVALQMEFEQNHLAVVETFGNLGDSAPEWCKNETNLTWTQRRERMQQHATLEWAKKQVKELRAANQSIPAWMEKMVVDDESRGRMKWAVQESKRLRQEGNEVPNWMAELVAEDSKWANRWAACKAADLKARGEEVPEWMAENARKGVLEYATEKAADLQEEIEDLEEQKQKEEALVQAKGDAKEAEKSMLARTRASMVRSTEQQLHVMEQAVHNLEEAEQALDGGIPGGKAQTKQAMAEAMQAFDVLTRMINNKLAMIESGL